jgi:hypothetical protein
MPGDANPATATATATGPADPREQPESEQRARRGSEPCKRSASEPRERYTNEPRERCQWSFDPWSERPVAAGIAALAVLAMWLILAACRLPWLLAFGLGGVVASPLAPAVLPVACRIEPDGAARRGALGWVRRSWADVRRIDDVPVGVFLSPYAARHWLDPTRGLTLPMPRSRRSELAAKVREQWGARAS